MTAFKTFLTAVLVSAACSTTALAHHNDYFGFEGGHHNGPRGFDSYTINSIEAIKRYGRDHERVMLRGRLTKYYGKGMYEFTDLNGDTIEVDLDDDQDWSFISKDQLIDVIGKLDVDMFSIELHVKAARPVNE